MSKRKKRTSRAVRHRHKRHIGKWPSSRKRKPRRQSKTQQDRRLQFGLRLLRTENSIADAARKSGIAPARLRAYAIKKKVLVRHGKRWIVEKDIARKLLIYSGGKEHAITVAKFHTASLVGTYMAGVRWFLQTNDLNHLEPFAGKFVTDISGKRFPLETRPNVLHRLANSGGNSFEDIYRLVI